jgi:hypothetical protein
MNPEQLNALERHGYPSELPRSGTDAGPGRQYGGYVRGEQVWGRSRVCMLDGIVIDGHEVSDLDCDNHCIHCGAEV